jgi:hypothetical protein
MAESTIFFLTLSVFALLYSTAFLSLKKWSNTVRTATLHHLICGIAAGVAAVGIGFALHAANIVAASAKVGFATVFTISPHELHRAADMRSMPVQTFEDHSLVFPKQ